MMLRATALFLLLAFPMLAPAKPPPAALAGYRVVYTLGISPSIPGIGRVAGTMDATLVEGCDGWTLDLRVQVSAGRGAGRFSVTAQAEGWEALDGHVLRLSGRLRVDREEDISFWLKLALAPQGGVARMFFPDDGDDPEDPDAPVVGEERTLQLGRRIVLPMGHTADLLAAARRGERRLVAPWIDPNAADGVTDIITEITPAAASARAPASLAGVRSWLMRETAAVPADAPQADEAVILYRLYDNGVADEVEITMLDFTARARLRELVLLPRRC